jgi:2-amino-4-hydroxy-6-hydroxymethyldihydropteridine diphosphokinase
MDLETEVYLLLGSNIGDRLVNIDMACELIRKEINISIETSRIYETAAWGKIDQSSFLNQAICIQTDIEPLTLLRILKKIEKAVGRIDTEKWGPRVIDIDILFYGQKVIQDPELQIPHPYLPVRRFVLLPMIDIAPHFMHPVLKKTITELLATCPDTSEVNVLV